MHDACEAYTSAAGQSHRVLYYHPVAVHLVDLASIRILRKNAPPASRAYPHPTWHGIVSHAWLSQTCAQGQIGKCLLENPLRHRIYV